LCAKIPKEFAKYLNYCRSLNFEDKPCVSDLRRLFKNLMKKKNLEYDCKFDWIKKKSKIPQEIGQEESEDDEEKNYHGRLKALLNI
jgi:hypothetical protein